MKMQPRVDPNGLFDVRYAAFLETVAHLRARLHRYCARMTNSVLDGEDVMQEALFEAYRKLEQLDDPAALRPWLFRIAHNRCIDFLRSRGARNAAEGNLTAPDSVPATEPATLGIRPAIEHLVVALPPKERACVLLKDVFDYSLEEVAELVDSTIGGVKAALKRGRTKLTAAPAGTKPPRTANPELTRLLDLYVERFNRQDWDGLRELISADAQLRVADAFEGPLADAPYFRNYARLSIPWKLSLCELDGEPVVVVLRRGADSWAPHSYVRLQMAEQQIDRIVDYSHCPWVASLAEPVAIADVTRGQYVSRNA
jgi:RNA polymerase sigma-70 factor (ECF subfamily)